MREFSLVHEMDATVDGYWRAFFDPAYEKAVVAALAYREYTTVERAETDTEIRQKTRAVPRLDVTAALGKLIGASFGYVEDGVFDKATRIWRTHTIPDAFKGRMPFDTVMRVEPGRTDASCRRTLEFRIDAHVRGIGSMLESSVEKNLRAGWEESTAFMNRWMRKT
jgi:Protein of unknown function (DUF2505)